MHDLRYAVRWLRRSPGFAAAAIASLPIGIGFNTALFSVVDAVLFRPLPVRTPAELVDIGIRMALGARPAAVLSLIMRQGLSVAAAGLGTGLLLALGATRVLAGMCSTASAWRIP